MRPSHVREVRRDVKSTMFAAQTAGDALRNADAGAASQLSFGCAIVVFLDEEDEVSLDASFMAVEVSLFAAVEATQGVFLRASVTP